MEILQSQSHQTSFSLYLLLLLHHLQLSSLSLLSSDYILPDNYFINCGSSSDLTVYDRNFIGDEKSDLISYTGKTVKVKDSNPSSNESSLYQNARVFKNPSSYHLEITQKGIYMVRLHFYAFSSPQNLSDAQFNVSAYGFPLLSHFSVQHPNPSSLPVIKEFIFTITEGKFRIHFEPSGISSFAFVNAIEVFLLPDKFTIDEAPHVTPFGGSDSSYSGLLSHALNPVHRINVGGSKITPDGDTLLRSWVPDDDFLLNLYLTKTKFSANQPGYQTGGATKYIAPDAVYQTAREMDPNLNGSSSSFFNITWRFNVSKDVRHLLRVHFCDIISNVSNLLQFNLYVYSDFSRMIYPYDTIPYLAAPFYFDFVVDADNSGFMNISIGPRNDSIDPTAFLNGLEIMELINSTGFIPEDHKSPNKKLLIGLVAGGVVLLFIILIIVFCCLKRYRKAKPVETSEWQAIPFYGGGSTHSRISERPVNGSPLCYLNLGLKLSFVDVQCATNNFDAKLMIGEGGFGKVYKGTLKNGIKVAVKRSEPGHGQGFSEFQTEVLVLSQIRHRHLVSLIGYCDEKSEMILVYEFMEKGTLRDHLYGSQGGSDKSVSLSQLSWNKRLEICIGAAKGLHYLHTSSDRGIIHRDVKSTNILLDENYVAKVADFGLSRLGATDQTYVSTDVKGSFGYLDPEYFQCLQLTQKSDVYSFGVVLLEVLCARPAINAYLPREQVNLAEWGLTWLKKGEIGKIIDPLLVGKTNPNSLRMYGGTVEKCLKAFGVDRPSMHDVLWDLEYALQLQQGVNQREPSEDSTTEASWALPAGSVQHLPSDSGAIGEYDISMADFSDGSLLVSREVFSQLNADDEAR